MRMQTVWDVRDAPQFNKWRKVLEFFYSRLPAGIERLRTKDDPRDALIWADIAHIERAMIMLEMVQPRRIILETPAESAAVGAWR